MMKSNSKAIKVVHFADLHLGVENYGKPDAATGLNQRVIDFLRNLKSLVDFAIEEDVALVVFCGDAYKNQKPSPTLQRELAKQIKRLTNAGVEVFLLVGNHDLPQAEKHAHSLSVFSALEAERVTVGSQMKVYAIETKDGSVDIAAIPHVSRSAILLREQYRDKTPSEIEELIGEEIDRRIAELSSELRPDVPAILAAHLTVSTAVFGSERSALIGNEMTISPSSLASGAFDYVALGHIHKFQDLSAGYPSIVYSGSLDRVDFGEENEDKGFCLVSLVKGMTTYKFIKTPARPFVTINVDCKTDEPTEEVVSEIEKRELAEAVARLRIRLPAHLKEHLRIEEIRRSLSKAHYAATVEVEPMGEAVRSRNPRLVESLGPLEALEEYILTRDDLKPRRQALLEKAKNLYAEMVAED